MEVNNKDSPRVFVSIFMVQYDLFFIQVWFPEDYPTQAPPKYELK